MVVLKTAVLLNPCGLAHVSNAGGITQVISCSRGPKNEYHELALLEIRSRAVCKFTNSVRASTIKKLPGEDTTANCQYNLVEL